MFLVEAHGSGVGKGAVTALSNLRSLSLKRHLRAVHAARLRAQIGAEGDRWVVAVDGMCLALARSRRDLGIFRADVTLVSELLPATTLIWECCC